MKNDVTELVFILDRSGSMAGLEDDTIGGFNSLIEKQKKETGKCLVSTVLFNSESKVIHDRMGLDDVPKMTRGDYVPCGSTALIDAIGCAVGHIGNIHKYARPEDVPKHTMFIITTDGMENASHIYSSDEVKRMISRRKEKEGWEFIFIGANIDAVETAGRFGIDAGHAANYHADREGTAVVYEAVSDTVRAVRRVGSVGSGWQKKINDDYNKRRK
ncbi:MAG: VWA domain-containing protein [Clostridia bacterium]|nr:VWA domain-containing protein [Clostridia bacterium]